MAHFVFRKLFITFTYINLLYPQGFFQCSVNFVAYYIKKYLYKIPSEEKVDLLFRCSEHY